MIDEGIRPDPVDPRDACYVNTFMKLFFRIGPLRLSMVAWPNRDRIISALHLMFGAMSQVRLIDAASLSTVCDPGAFDGKYCLELGLQILGALRDASSECLGAQFNNCSLPERSLAFLPLSSPDEFPIDVHSFDTVPFPDPLLGSNA
jgi:hypothetical protein